VDNLLKHIKELVFRLLVGFLTINKKIQNMRERLEQQTKLGLKLISATRVMIKSRDDIPCLVSALLKIYSTPKCNAQLFSILENSIVGERKRQE